MNRLLKIGIILILLLSLKEMTYPQDIDFNFLRERMVETQIKKRGIKDKRVLEAMLKVERHKFVGESQKPLPMKIDLYLSDMVRLSLSLISWL